MVQARRQIPPERKRPYYIGMGVLVAGLLLFLSNFLIMPGLMCAKHEARPGDADFFDRVQDEDAAVGRSMAWMAVRAIAGFVLFVAGGIIMNVAARGAAGSGFILDPEQARKDLEPWSRLKGGVVQDALSEVEVVEKLEDRLEGDPIIRVRCPKCKALNEETAKFCNQCGAGL